MPEPVAPHPNLVQNYARQDVRFVRGQGCRLWDDRGREYLDAFAGIAVCSLGHCHPALVAALREQAGALWHVGNHYHHPAQERLAGLLAARSLPRVFFCNSGTEANECAVKVARLHGGAARPRLVAAQGAFHGRTLGALALTANPRYREPFAPLAPVEFVPFGDAAALERAVGPDVAAVFLEPVQGEGGVIPAPAGYLAAARALCDRHGALLVLDEIQIGIGRSGRFNAYDWAAAEGCSADRMGSAHSPTLQPASHAEANPDKGRGAGPQGRGGGAPGQPAGIRPDVVTWAKGLAGGVPIGAAAMSEACAALLKPGLHGTTFGGNPLACTAAAVVVEAVATEPFLAAVRERSAQLMAGLRRVFPAAAEVRGLGLLIGVQFDRDIQPLIRAGFEHGVVVGPSGTNCLRLAPPLTITAAEVDGLLTRLEGARRAAFGA